jgi:hypothetical protein
MTEAIAIGLMAAMVWTGRPDTHQPEARAHSVAIVRDVVRPGLLTGKATWYDYVPGGAAAGPALRKALGSHWRGRSVSACRGDTCVTVTLSDWCACGHGRVIDLDDRSFAKLAPLSAGVITVKVRPT